MADKPELSIVVPTYNEQGNIEALVHAIQTVFAEDTGWELLLVDDGSTDASAELAASIARRDPRVRALALSRNFGKEAAILAGLHHASGCAVAVMDADLQHPPELLPRMLEIWRQGRADIVDGVKRSRGHESAAHRLAARLFNRFMAGAGGSDAGGSSDFKLMDARVAQIVAAFPERTRFFRGLTEWAGFRHVRIEYDVARRLSGKSGWSLRGLLRYSLSGIVAFSSAPLRAISSLGFITILFSIALGIDTLYMKLSGRAVEGFTTVLLSVAFFSGAVILCLGVMGEYLARMYDELKHRPAYILKTEDTSPATPPRHPRARVHVRSRNHHRAGQRKSSGRAGAWMRLIQATWNHPPSQHRRASERSIHPSAEARRSRNASRRA